MCDFDVQIPMVITRVSHLPCMWLTMDSIPNLSSRRYSCTQNQEWTLSPLGVAQRQTKLLTAELAYEPNKGKWWTFLLLLFIYQHICPQIDVEHILHAAVYDVGCNGQIKYILCFHEFYHLVQININYLKCS